MISDGMNHIKPIPVVVLSILMFLDVSFLAAREIPQQNGLPLTLIESIRFSGEVRFCGEKIPIQSQPARESLEKEMLLALWDRPQVILWMKRAARYFPHIEPILKQHGLPDDLKYVALIESALRPHAVSSKGAVGFWQFLRGTGRQYGLKIDSIVDERRDLFKSTIAACSYFKSLHEKFGSWLLAMSAYNMGQYGLKERIDAQENQDFFSLHLPFQTQRYIFKATAVKMIFENPEKYGYVLKPEDLYPIFSCDRINLDSEITLPVLLVAKSAGMTYKEIKDYNPHLRGGYLNRGHNTIYIPKGTAKAFKERFAELRNDWEKDHHKRIHVVRKGENLSFIAQKYGISLSKLIRLNGLSKKRVIHPGDRLVVE